MIVVSEDVIEDASVVGCVNMVSVWDWTVVNVVLVTEDELDWLQVESFALPTRSQSLPAA